MKNNFFIVGTGRCGTTLLRDMLILHPDVNIIIESHFLPVLYDLYGLTPITFEQYFSVIDNHYSSHGVKWIQIILKFEKKASDNFKQSFASFCADLPKGTIVEYTDRLHRFIYGPGDYWIGDKTPEYGVVMSDLKNMWPLAKFIHVIRDGVYAGRSMTKHHGFIRFINEGISPENWARSKYQGRILKFGDMPVTLKDATHFWHSVTLKILDEAKKISSDDYCEIKYEDLLRRPKRTLNTIEEFLGLPKCEKWEKEASLLPRPFALLDNPIPQDVYSAVVSTEVYTTLQRFGYPFPKQYDLRDGTFFSELWRSISFHLYPRMKRAKKILGLTKSKSL